MTRPFEENHIKIKYVRAAERSGILERRGAQSELARMLGVSRQYVGYLRRVVRSEGSGEQDTRGNEDGI